MLWFCPEIPPYFHFGAWQECECTGDGCDCMLAGMSITMADGSTKPVESIRAGDVVLAYDEATGLAATSAVRQVRPPFFTTHYYLINGKIRATENHPMLIAGRWTRTRDVNLGDRLTGANGRMTPVFSIQRVDDHVRVYNFEVGLRTYIAEGVVVHKKPNCLLYVQKCPGCPEP